MNSCWINETQPIGRKKKSVFPCLWLGCIFVQLLSCNINCQLKANSFCLITFGVGRWEEALLGFT